MYRYVMLSLTWVLELLMISFRDISWDLNFERVLDVEWVWITPCNDDADGNDLRLAPNLAPKTMKINYLQSPKMARKWTIKSSQTHANNLWQHYKSYTAICYNPRMINKSKMKSKTLPLSCFRCCFRFWVCFFFIRWGLKQMVAWFVVMS